MLTLDLFAGPGGWDVYDHELGILTLRVENDPSARATATAAGFVNTHDDVTTYHVDRPYVGLKASPPCQTFSAAGKGEGRKALDVVIAQLHRLADGHPLDYSHYSDPRTGLVLEPLRIILEHRFRWIVLEQVPAVLPIWDEYAKILSVLGYSVVAGNLQAEQYGVPQTRKRAVLIATLDGVAALPTPTHSEYYNRNPSKLDTGVNKWVSMAEALGVDGFAQEQQTGMGALARAGRTTRPVRTADQPSFTITGAGKDHTGKMGGCARLRMIPWVPDTMAGAGATAESTSGQRPRSVDAPAHTITGAGSAAWMYVGSTMPNATVRPADHPAPTIAFGNVAEPSYTVRANGSGSHPSGTGRVTDTSASVRVSVEEAAVLQTFPADYPWRGTKTRQYQQVGNAIPPLLARAILRQVV